uniref:Phosphate-selective porin o/p n=1 Tax=uncultured bacterium F42-01 TaxID=1191438 RepID=I3VIJ9_9BACT|nr:phosphate-selective porin o/p [uncultured bacterium F42-01]
MLRHALAALLSMFAVATPSFAQQPAPASPDSIPEPALAAGEADAEKPRRNLFPYFDWNFGVTTFHIGLGGGFDVATFEQDEDSKEQLTMDPGVKLRDFRFIANGRTKLKRLTTWQIGVMWDGVKEDWFVRQTGVMVAVPEIWGNIFIGRAKEGFSLSKVIQGYQIIPVERMTFTDATIPILADGIKWLGYVPDKHIFWNLGAFTDWLSEHQSFASYNYQFALRGGWAPMESASAGKLFHVGVNLRHGQVDNGELQLRSRPESNVAPYFIDTGKFRAESTNMAGLEAFYRPGAWMFGTEYYWQFVNSPETGDPMFHGGEVFASWFITGETRAYNTNGAFFKGISPRKTLFEGGPGAIEAVVRFSYSDFDNAGVHGGEFWRITPMVNWLPPTTPASSSSTVTACWTGST